MEGIIALVSLILFLVLYIGVIVAAVYAIKACRLLRPLYVHLGNPSIIVDDKEKLYIVVSSRRSALIVSNIGYMIRDSQGKSHMSFVDMTICEPRWKDGELSFPLDVWNFSPRAIYLKSRELAEHCSSLGLKPPLKMVAFAQIEGLPTCYSKELQFDPGQLE